MTIQDGSQNNKPKNAAKSAQHKCSCIMDNDKPCPASVNWLILAIMAIVIIVIGMLLTGIAHLFMTTQIYWGILGLLNLCLFIERWRAFRQHDVERIKAVFIVFWIVDLLWIGTATVVVLPQHQKEWADLLFFASIALVSGFQAQRHPQISAMGFMIYVLVAFGTIMHLKALAPINGVLREVTGTIGFTWLIITIMLVIYAAWGWIAASVSHELNESVESKYREKGISERQYKQYLSKFFEATRNIVWQATTSLFGYLAVMIVLIHRQTAHTHFVNYLAWSIPGVLLIASIYRFQIELAKREAWMASENIKQARSMLTNPINIVMDEVNQTLASVLNATILHFVQSVANKIQSKLHHRTIEENKTTEDVSNQRQRHQ